MENYFAEVMSKNSDAELFNIIENKNTYTKEACLAAIEELEKRNLANEALFQLKKELAEKGIEELKEAEETEETKTARKQALKEALDFFIPKKDYFYTPVIIYLNILIAIIMILNGVHPFEPSVADLVQWGGNLRALTLNGESWRLLTNIFLHGGIVHLLFNMYSLLYVGGLLERTFGNHRFLLVYLMTGIFASIVSISYNANVVSIGASGAIFGMYGLFLSLLISKKLSIPEESKQNALSSILLFIGYNLFYGFAKEGIDNAAHIGGLVSGIIIGLIYYPSLRMPQYSQITSWGLIILTLSCVYIAPRVITNPEGDFQNVMNRFIENENKALWMYRENLSDITPDKYQVYYNRYETEGTVLWEDNLKLLASLPELPPYLKERVDLLTEYCNLRKESCKTMQSLMKQDNFSDQKKLDKINVMLKSTIDKIDELDK